MNADRSDLPVIAIRARSGFSGLRFEGVWTSRFLLGRLARRDITLRYRQTALGVTWVILQPLLAAGVLSFVFGSVAKLPADGTSYYALTLSGYVGWSFFATIVTKGSMSIIANAGMISKVFFPRLLLPLSTVLSGVVDLLVGIGLLLITLVVTGTGLSISILAVIPILAGLAVVGFAIAAATSALSVPYRDVNYVLPVLLQLMLYASPVAYGLQNVPESFRRWMAFNPLVGFLEGMRWACLPGREFPLFELARSSAVALVLLAIGLIVFERIERDFADVI